MERAFPPLPPGLHCGSISCLLRAALTSDICRQDSTFLIWQVLLLLEDMFMPGICGGPSHMPFVTGTLCDLSALYLYPRVA